MGRATSGVIGMRFNDGDELLGMYVVRDGEDVLVATEDGYAKRTPADQYPLRNRGGLGVITAQITEGRGGLVGALLVRPDDEVFAITSARRRHQDQGQRGAAVRTGDDGRPADEPGARGQRRRAGAERGIRRS